jgi:AraC-like DNA-binding protein
MFTRPSIRAVRLDAIKREIAEHLDCRDLSLAAVARRQRITPRYVQLLFHAEGTTFSRFVLRERLRCARRMLMHPQYASWTISGIAFEVGFGDLSYFTHAFRRHYGASPSITRKAARENCSATFHFLPNASDIRALEPVDAPFGASVRSRSIRHDGSSLPAKTCDCTAGKRPCNTALRRPLR